MESLDQYAFMEMLPESEAIAQGINLSDRFLHAVYKAVRSLSDPSHAKRRNLFTIESEVPDLNQIARKDLAMILKKMTGEKLIVQLFRIEYQEGEATCRVVPCFVGFTDDDRNHVSEIYSILLESSVESLERYLKSSPAFQQDAFWKELELDLKSEQRPDPSSMPISQVDLFKSLNPAKMEVPPHGDLIPRFRRDLENELVVRKKIVKLSMYNHMPVREEDAGIRFDTAADFLQSKVLPKYKNRGDLKRRLEAVALEEASYYQDEFAPHSSTFPASRAKAIHEVAGDGKGSDGRYPGALAVDILISLENRAGESFREKMRSENGRILTDIRGRLLNPRAAWDDMILYMDDKDFENLHPDVRRSLQDDKKLLTGNWEQPGGTIHVYLRNDPYAFRTIVAGMTDVKSEDAWKVLAMRHLLDKYDEHFENLFQDPDFVRMYGKLLRTVYMNYMPFWHRLLFLLGIHIFQDAAFAAAKKLIDEEQIRRANKNQEWSGQRKKQKEEERKKTLNRFETKTAVNRILERLDDFYFEKVRVPSVVDVYSSLEEKEETIEAFMTFLKKEGFQILSIKKGETPGDAILLYPMDHEWRVRSARLVRNLERVKEEREKIGEDDYENRILLERSRKVIKHAMESSSARQSRTSLKGGSGKDPYGDLQREMEKREEDPIDLAGEEGEPTELDI